MDDATSAAQIRNLGRLRDGWLDGAGKAPDPRRLRWLANQFARHYPDDAPVPYAYPTPEGDVQVEWTIGGVEAEIVISLASGTAEWLATNVDTMESSEATLDLNQPDNWQWLVNRLRALRDTK